MYRTAAHISGIFTGKYKLSSLVPVGRRLTSLTLITSMSLVPVPPALAQPTAVGAASTTSFLASSVEAVAGSLAWLGLAAGQKGETPTPEIIPPQRPPTKDELKQRVARIEMNSPGEVELRSQEPMIFTAIPLDSEGSALHGLTAEWASSDRQVVFVKPDGQAVAGQPGRAHLTATVGNKKEKVWVTVLKGPKEKFGGKKQSSDSEGGEIGRRVGRGAQVVKALWNPVENGWPVASKMKYGRAARVVNAAFVLREPSDDPLPDTETESLYSPSNDVGTPPGKTEPGATRPPAAMDGTETPGSSNFSFEVPVAGLPGRGEMSVSLSLAYNSRLWNKSNAVFGTRLTYDVDTGWPAPGFRLGYGQIEAQGSQGFTLTDPNGTRRQLRKLSTNQSDYNYETTDGSYTRFHGGMGWGTVTYTDGSRVDYGAAGSNGFRSYPTKIIDRNGNYILISYVGGVGPRISSVQDTLGRYIRFYYSATNDLVAVTVPGYGGGADRQAIRFYYETININPAGSFNVVTFPTGASTARVIRYINFPGTQTGHRYDYSSYGMIYRITKLRQMSVSYAGLDQTGTVTSEGQMAASTEYNYPVAPANLSDAPDYTRRTDDWAGRTTGMNGTSSAPYYIFGVNKTTGLSTVTAPDGTATETKVKMSAGQWNDGLVEYIAVKRGTTVVSKSTVAWEHDGSLRNPRIREASKTDEANQTKTTVFSHTDYNNVSVISERGYGGEELRRTETTYETRAEWVNRRLMRLPTSVKVFAGGATTPASRTDYAYDTAGTNLTARSGLIMHDPAWNPFSPTQENCYWADDPSDPDCLNSDCWQWDYSCDGYCGQSWQCDYYNPYNPATDKRGNITTVTRYANATTGAGSTTDTFTYDIAGNATTATASCCRQKAFTYSADYHYALATGQQRGGAGGLSSSATYDFNTGLMRTATDQNGQTTTAHYYPSSLRHFRTERPDGSYTESVYNDGLVADPDPSRLHSYVLTKSLFDTGREVLSYVFLDGRGAPARTFYGVSNNFLTADTEYDVMGRAYRWSNRYHSTGSADPVNPSGEWTTSRYDALGRTDQVTLPDGALTQTTYAGTVTTGTDPAGKSRRQIVDALGRLVRLDEPNDTGDLGTVSAPTRPTSYQYDALNNLVRITQEGQSRFFKYDSLGRLTHDRQVEQGAPHYAPDSQTGNNEWSSRVVYNVYGMVEESFDARGVRSGFIYDGLNRVKEINYSDGTPTITYTYDTATPGYYNRGHLQRVVTAATSSTPETSHTYNYDRMGRISNHQQSIGANVYTLAYTYNFAGALKNFTYPSGRTVTYSYDQLNRLSGAADANRTYASNISYNPHGGLSSETLGNGASHTAGYNSRAQTSWIDLAKNGATLQRYDYKYGVVDQNTGAVDETKNNGQIARIESSIGAASQPSVRQWQQRVSYDPLGRLSVFGEYRGDNLALTLKAHYTHDRYGNRFQTGAQNIGIDYLALSSSDVNAATNRILSSAGYTMEYDGAGNLTRDGRFRQMQYAYDANARQKYAARLDGTHGVVSAYDALGQRVLERVVLTTRHMIYDAFGKLVSEYATLRTGQQRWERDHIYRNNQVVAIDEAAPTCYKTLDQFVGDFYQGALARQPNRTELATWKDRLTKAQARGGGYLLAEAQALGDALFNSAEYAARARTDRDFVYDIYKSYLQREPDQGGWDAWTNAVPVYGRAAVRQGFVTSSEFGDNVALLCVTSGTGGVRYLLMDHQGSIRVVMNEAGAVVARHDMLPYGEEIWAGAGMRTAAQGYAQTDEVRQHYALTERAEATGLEHTLWRKYDSWQGRWTSPDPYRRSMTAGNPQSFNRYAYVNNDPLNLIDPIGLCTFNINLRNTSDLSEAQLEGVKKEITEIFEAAGQQVKFDNPGGASGPRLTFNLNIVTSYPSNVHQNARRNGFSLRETMGYTMLGRDRRPANTGYVATSEVALATGTYAYPFSIGRVGAHEAGHFFLNIRHSEGLDDGLMTDQPVGEELGDDKADDLFRFTPEQAEKLSNLCPPEQPNINPGIRPGGRRGRRSDGSGGDRRGGGGRGALDWLHWLYGGQRQAEWVNLVH